MRIAYLYNRPASSAADMGVEKVFVDYPNTRRMELGDLLLALVEGDTLVLRTARDFGTGARAKVFRERVEGMGVEIEIIPEDVAKPCGRQPHLRPTDEQRQQLCALWRSPAEVAHVFYRARQIMGQPVNRNQMNRLCGPRHKRKGDG